MNAVMNTITPARPRHAWPWLLGGLLLLCLLAAGSVLAWLMDMGNGFQDGVHIALDGEDFGGEGAGAKLTVPTGLLAGGAALFVGLLLALLAVLVVVPLALALALALLGVGLGIAAAVFSVLAVAAALLLPLWLPLWLLWLLLRPKPAVGAPATAPASAPDLAPAARMAG